MEEGRIQTLGNIASYLSVLVWTATLSLLMQCGAIPPLLLVGLTAMVLGLLQAAGELKADGLAGFRADARACLFAATGTSGHRLLYIPAVFMIDPIEVANLAEGWIAGAIVLGTLAAGNKLTARHLFGIGCYAAGVLIVIHDGLAPGHVMALGGGLLFAWYIVKSPEIEGLSGKASAIGNLCAGLLLIYLSMIAEWPWTVGGSDLLWLLGVLFAVNVGCMLWQFGMTHGEPRRAKVSVLWAPALSVMWICVVGGLRLDGWHMLSTAAVTLAGLIVSPYVFKAVKTARS